VGLNAQLSDNRAAKGPQIITLSLIGSGLLAGWAETQMTLKEIIMWYQEEKGDLRYDMPICAKSKDTGRKFILMPQISKSYDIIGFNWFCFDTGKYNSFYCYKSAREAVDGYLETHVITNADIAAFLNSDVSTQPFA